MALLFRNWTLQYNAFTQSPRGDETSEKYARRNAVFAQGIYGPYIRWGEDHEIIYLHFSLLLFIAGSLIYLFNINRTVFYAVVWWVGYMTISYAGATASIFVKPHDLLGTPLSSLALRIYLWISYVVSQVCSYLPPLLGFRDNITRHHRDLRDRYGKGFLLGKLKVADEAASKPSWKIDGMILDRIMAYLDEDHGLEAFFNAIPGYCNSELTDLPLPSWVRKKLRQSLDGFLNRTFSSSLISESDRTGQLITCLNAAHAALHPHEVSEIFDNIFSGHWDEALQFIQKWDSLRPWGPSQIHDRVRQIAVACIIPRLRTRDDRWIKLVKETFGVPDRVILDYLAHGDSVLLSVIIHISREANRADSWSLQIPPSLSQFDICNTLPGLQHDFCAMWNETVQDARNRGSYSIPVKILQQIRHVFIALHQGTDTSPTTFSTPDLDRILSQPSSYPLCDIASHRPDSTTHFHVTNSCTVSIFTDSTQPSDSHYASPLPPSHGGSTDPHQTEQANIIVGLPFPSNQTTTSEVGGTSHTPIAMPFTNPIHSSPRLTDASPPGVATAPQDIPLSPTLSHPLEGTTQRDIVAPITEPDISEVLFTASTPAPASTLAPVPASTPPVLSESYDTGAVSTNNPLPSASSVCFSIPASPPPSRDPSLPNAKSLALLSGATIAAAQFRPTSNVTRPRPRVCGLANSGSMCFANATLQLLVHSPPFWNLFRELGDLKGQRGAGDPGTGSGATPLVDATLRFFEEFRSKEKEPLPMQQPLQQAARAKSREDEEEREEHGAVDSFEPLYMYDAMKEKRQLKYLLVRSCATLRPAVSELWV